MSSQPYLKLYPWFRSLINYNLYSSTDPDFAKTVVEIGSNFEISFKSSSFLIFHFPSNCWFLDSNWLILFLDSLSLLLKSPQSYQQQSNWITHNSLSKDTESPIYCSGGDWDCERMDSPINAIKTIIAHKTTINLLFFKKLKHQNTSINVKILYILFYFILLPLWNKALTTNYFENEQLRKKFVAF